MLFRSRSCEIVGHDPNEIAHRLDAHNEATNEAMLAVNLRLGYEPVCDLVGVVSDDFATTMGEWTA